MAETYELFDELRKVMDQAGETPQGLMAMAVIQLHERLLAIEDTIDRNTGHDWRGNTILRCGCDNCI